MGKNSRMAPNPSQNSLKIEWKTLFPIFLNLFSFFLLKSWWIIGIFLIFYWNIPRFFLLPLAWSDGNQIPTPRKNSGMVKNPTNSGINLGNLGKNGGKTWKIGMVWDWNLQLFGNSNPSSSRKAGKSWNLGAFLLLEIHEKSGKKTLQGCLENS